MHRKPDWLKVPPPWGARFSRVRRLLRQSSLHTVCEQARCPNVGECFGRGTATFLLLGNRCTRSCSFCNISTGPPAPPDPDEPERLARAVVELGLKWVVVTSVSRDDLPDGGAQHFADTIHAVRASAPNVGIEVLIPDFSGNEEALNTVLDAGPDVLNHNVETIERLYPDVRPEADFRRSLRVLGRAAAFRNGSLIAKTGIMVGLGESSEEVLELLPLLRSVGCSAITIGQYLPPSPTHARLDRYVEPSEFRKYESRAFELGFTAVFSAPLVRSSYHAEELAGKTGSAGNQ